jgi:hypothetical protein
MSRLDTWMPGIAGKFTQSAQTAMAGHDEPTVKSDFIA